MGNLLYEVTRVATFHDPAAGELLNPDAADPDRSIRRRNPEKRTTVGACPDETCYDLVPIRNYVLDCVVGVRERGANDYHSSRYKLS